MIRHRWPGHNWPTDRLTTAVAAVVVLAVALAVPLFLYLELS